jgi:hypothetical protein
MEARAEGGGAAAACRDDTSLESRPTLRARAAAGVSPPGQAGLGQAHGGLDAALELGHPTVGLIHVRLPPWLWIGVPPRSGDRSEKFRRVIWNE